MKLKKIYWFILDMIISTLAASFVIFNVEKNLDIYISIIIGLFLFTSIIILGSELRIYNKNSPKTLKILLIIFSSASIILLVYLLLWIIFPELKFIDTIEKLQGIALGGWVISAFIERRMIRA